MKSVSTVLASQGLNDKRNIPCITNQCSPDVNIPHGLCYLVTVSGDTLNPSTSLLYLGVLPFKRGDRL